VRLVFLVGQGQGAAREVAARGDLLVAGPGSPPALAGLLWARAACPDAATVATEDDQYLDLYSLLTLARRLPPGPRLLCPVVRGEPPPPALPPLAWPDSPLPPFCPGLLHLSTPAAAARLLAAARTHHLLPGLAVIPEVFLTGQLALEAGVPHSDLSPLWTLSPVRLVALKLAQHPRLRHADLVAGPVLAELTEQWSDPPALLRLLSRAAERCFRCGCNNSVYRPGQSEEGEGGEDFLTGDHRELASLSAGGYFRSHHQAERIFDS
jgi:hypothetical protein